MPDFDACIAQYEVFSPQEAIRTLSGERSPLVTLYTQSGHQFSGKLIRKDKQDRPFALLQLTDDLTRGTAQSNEILYIDFADVTAIRIHESTAVAPVLSGGKISRPPGETGPSRLELKRLLEQMSQQFQLQITADWDNIPTSDDANLNLNDLSQALSSVLTSLTQDSLGREALKKFSILLIRHQNGKSLAITPNDATLVLELDITRTLPNPLVPALSKLLDVAL